MARCWGLDSPVTLGNLRGLQESSGSPAQNVVIHLLSEQQGHSESCQCMLWGNRVATAELSGGAWKQIAVNVVCRDKILKHFSWTSARSDSKTSWWLPLKPHMSKWVWMLFCQNVVQAWVQKTSACDKTLTAYGRTCKRHQVHESGSDCG